MERDPLLSSSDQNEEKSGAPWLLRYRCSKYFILATVTVAIFTDTFFFVVIIPAVPFILQERCNVPEEDIQFWASALLAIAGASIIVGSPFGGWCTDNMKSRKIPFYVGLAILAVSPILFGVATNVWMLIASRICFGFSSSIVYTVGLALLIDSVDTEQVGEWIGTALSGATVGMTISPILGGFVYARAKIIGLVGMMIGLVGIDIILRVVMIERGEAARWLGPSILPKKTNHFVDHNQSGQEPPSGAKDKKKSAPLLRLLHSGRVWADLYGIFMNFSVINAFDAVLPVFVRQEFGFSSTEAGLMFLNLAIPSLLAPLAGKLSAKFGTRRIAIIGCVLGCPALICMRLVTDDSPGHIALLCVLLVITGLALSLVMTPIAADLSFATDKIEEEEPGVFGPRGAYGQVYALFNMSMAGAAMAGPVIGGGLRDKLGWGSMSLVLGLWCLSAAVPVFFLIDDNKQDISMAVHGNTRDEDAE